MNLNPCPAPLKACPTTSAKFFAAWQKFCLSCHEVEWAPLLDMPNIQRQASAVELTNCKPHHVGTDIGRTRPLHQLVHHADLESSAEQCLQVAAMLAARLWMLLAGAWRARISKGWRQPQSPAGPIPAEQGAASQPARGKQKFCSCRPHYKSVGIKERSLMTAFI